MSASAILETIIGLVFVFAVMSLFASAFAESISILLQRRARYLLTGLRSMLDEEVSDDTTPVAGTPAPTAQMLFDATLDKSTAKTAYDRTQMTISLPLPVPGAPAVAGTAAPGDLTLALFNHPLIRSLQSRRVTPGRTGKKRNPQYIPPKLFAQALIDTLLPDVTPQGTPNLSVIDALTTSVSKLGGFPAQQSLLALLKQSDDELDKFQASLEGWYDAQMGRISGWYKRWAKVVLGVIGVILAIIVNVDPVQISTALYNDAPLRAAIIAEVPAATACQSEESTPPGDTRTCAEEIARDLDLAGLPLGYPDTCDLRPSHIKECFQVPDAPAPTFGTYLLKAVGWLLTGFAVSFGAPFWFDALSKLGSLRTAGPKPSKVP